MKISENLRKWRHGTRKIFFSCGLKFNLASVKIITSIKKVFWMWLWIHGAQHHRPRNNTGHDSISVRISFLNPNGLSTFLAVNADGQMELTKNNEQLTQFFNKNSFSFYFCTKFLCLTRFFRHFHRISAFQRMFHNKPTQYRWLRNGSKPTGLVILNSASFFLPLPL